MWTLSDFYKSKDWQRLVTIIRAERTDQDGMIICEECGRPIVRKFDCIAHHCKTFLTEENVNDRMISLNPDNIALVHAACHNRIHDKLGYSRKEIYLVYGSPLAGKRTFTQGAASPGDLIVNMDAIWECITCGDRYTKPGKLNAVAFGVRDFLLDCVRTKRGRWNNAYICGGYPLISERERIIRETGAREMFIDTSREECLNRAEMIDDPEARKKWREYIEDWWRKHDRDPKPDGTPPASPDFSS